MSQESKGRSKGKEDAKDTGGKGSTSQESKVTSTGPEDGRDTGGKGSTSQGSKGTSTAQDDARDTRGKRNMSQESKQISAGQEEARDTRGEKCMSEESKGTNKGKDNTHMVHRHFQFGYPMNYQATTEISEDGYPQYCQCEDPDKMYKAFSHGKPYVFTNCDVVPYNKYFLYKYDCHFNVEYCHSVAGNQI